jgi:transcriptional regulator with XRE-family HTH domain
MMVKTFGELLGYHPSYITKLENGTRDPSLTFILRLIEVSSPEERMEILQDVGLDDLDSTAVEVHLAMRSGEWSQERKSAFRQTVRTMIRTVS